MNLAEIIEKAKKRNSSIEFQGKTTFVNLKSQADFKIIDGVSYARIGAGIRVNYFILDYIDDNDNCHSHPIPAIAFVRVGDATHRDNVPVYAITGDLVPQQCGFAKLRRYKK